MKERPVVPMEEMLRQQEFMKLVASLEERPHSYHIVSMGCQMNERDSESIAGMLNEMGMTHEAVRERASAMPPRATYAGPQPERGFLPPSSMSAYQETWARHGPSPAFWGRLVPASGCTLQRSTAHKTPSPQGSSQGFSLLKTCTPTRAI